MQIKNTQTHYGIIHVLIHWVTAGLIVAVFPLGLVMVNLGYYDAGYQTYPPIHKSLGMIIFFLTVFRLFWVIYGKIPNPLPQPKSMEILAKLAHGLLYVCLMTVLISGYMISTADGRGIVVFDWFTVPALVTPFEGQADTAGRVHLYAAWVLVGVIALHLLAALKHHFINKDRTLKRILGL